MISHFATLNDIPIIQKIAYIAWPIAYKDILSPEQIAYDLQRSYSTETLRQQIEKENNQFFILGNEQSPIGFAAASPWHENAQHLFLQKIYLMPDLKGKGNGKSLMDSVEQYGKDQGYKKVSLLVNRYNEDAIKFYKRQGFKIIEKRDEAIGGVDGKPFLRNDYLMTKNLES